MSQSPNPAARSAQIRKSEPVALQSSPTPRRLPPYNVVLLNDDDHTYEYVMEMLSTLFGYNPTKSYLMADQLNPHGRVIVLTTTKEHAELKREQILGFGPDERIKQCAGSMSAIIEPAQ